MENPIYVSPVGIVKKDIYIIKNDINRKVYVGQSKDVKERFKSHCKSTTSLLGQAIKKYGKEHFWYEIIEKDVADPNEREQYWIRYYNSISPFGYNIMTGGDKPPIWYGDDHPNVQISDEDVRQLKYDLANTQIPLSALAKKYNISKKQVLRINHGASRISEADTYPIRKTPNVNGKLTEDDVDIIIDLLQHTYRFNGDIGRQFGVNEHSIKYINDGVTHHRDNIKYPIRIWKSSGKFPVTYEQVTEIMNLLRDTSRSINSIAKEYGVNFSIISSINRGTSKKYRRDGIKYPIRPF